MPFEIGDWIQENETGLRGVVLQAPAEQSMPYEVFFLTGEHRHLDSKDLKLRPLRRAMAVSFEGKVSKMVPTSEERGEGKQALGMEHRTETVRESIVEAFLE